MFYHLRLLITALLVSVLWVGVGCSSAKDKELPPPITPPASGSNAASSQYGSASAQSGATQPGSGAYGSGTSAGGNSGASGVITPPASGTGQGQYASGQYGSGQYGADQYGNNAGQGNAGGGYGASGSGSGYGTSGSNGASSGSSGYGVGATSYEAARDMGKTTNFDQSWSKAEADAASFLQSSNIYFYYNSAKLTAEAQAVLRQKAGVLAQFPTLRMAVSGHADERGSVEANQNISDRRAKAACDYLRSQGVPSSQLDYTGLSSRYPAFTGKTEAIYSKNRRCEFGVSKYSR